MMEDEKHVNENELDKLLFAKALQRAAKKKGITQDALAEEIGKSKNTVAQMFTAQRFTSIPTLVALCDVLEVTPDYLLAQYLKEPESKRSEDEYHEILKKLSNLKQNELMILNGIIDLLMNNRN